MSIDPYATIGLRGNPFFAEEEVGVPEALWLDRGFSTAPPVRAKRLVQVMGDKGAGKTSHLKHWQAQADGPYCYYPEGRWRWKFPLIAAIAYWDEANRIPLLLLVPALWRASHLGATIVAGTHTDLSHIARLVGLEVYAICLPQLEVEPLIAWVKLRIEAVRLPEATVKLELTPDLAAEIVLTAKSWREAAVLLHIWAAKTASAAI